MSALLDERLGESDHLLHWREADTHTQHVGPRRVIEPQVVNTGDAVPGIEDDIHEVLALPDLAQPVRERHLGFVSSLRERLDTRGHRPVGRTRRGPWIAVNLRIVRKGKRAAEQKRNPGVVQPPQRVHIEAAAGSCIARAVLVSM